MWIITVEQTVEGLLLIAIVSELSIPAGVNQLPLFVYSYLNTLVPEQSGKVKYEREKLAGSDE